MSATAVVVPKTREKPGLTKLIKYEHLLAGVSGGLASTLVLHPLDLIKIRFAVNDGRVQTPKYIGITNAFRTIVRDEGYRGLYKGVTPNLWGSGLSWGLYFLFFNSLKSFVQQGDSKKPLGAVMHLVVASEAGIMTLFLTNPIWVVKTRLCLQSAEMKYLGLTDALVKIYKTEGIRGYYKGILPGIFGVSHGAIQFMVYEELKNSYNQYKHRPITTKLKNSEYLTFAAVSKLVAVAVTYPYQVVRLRLQDQFHSYTGVTDCIGKTWQYDTWRGFYKGLGANLLKVVPATMITFVIYENVSHFLLHYKS